VKRTIGILLIFALVLTPFTFSDINKSLTAEAANNTVGGLQSQISSQKLKISNNAAKQELSGTTYGEYIVIDHGGGMTTLYAHNSQIVKKVGDKVYKGDVIAKIGMTRAATGPHCHFEVAINGARQNPHNYVVKP